MIAPSVNARLIQRRLLRLAAESRGALLLAAVSVLGGGLATVGQMLVAGALMAGAFANSPADGVALQLLTWLLALVAVRAAFAGLTEWAGHRIATHSRSRLRLELVESLIARGPAALSREHTGEIVTTAMDGVEDIEPFYRRFLPQAMTTAIVPLIVFATVMWIDPVSGIVLAVTGPLIPVFMWLLGTLAEQRTRDQWTALSHLGGRFLDTLQGLPTLVLFGRATDAASRLTEASEQLRVRTMGVLRVAFLSGFVLELVASLSTAVVAVGVGVRLIEGWIAFEPGLVVLLLAPEFYLPFRQLGQRHHAAMEGVAAADRVFALIDAPRSGDGRSAGDEQSLPQSCEVVFDEVSAAYPGSDIQALDGVSLTLRPRTLTAVVGPSGAGKSTLVRVLLRFLDPCAGRVLLNGRDSRQMKRSEWRRHIAFVPQRPRFIDGSVLDNLRIAQPGASMDAVVSAARLAHAHAFIAALPAGYDTHIDDTASGLSGGERQRLAIARALLKPCPILVLDEPTSSVDAETEALIAGTLERVARERTVLVVTHRPGTVGHAEIIVEMDAGGASIRVPGAAAREVA